MRLKELCKDILTEKELQMLPSSFDVVGDILIFVDFSKELKKKEKKIGEKILETFPRIKVVCKKARKYSGKYRLAKMQIISGENRKETVHRESGIQIKLDVEKIYFSPRSSNERLRIAKLISNNESVLVMFSGSGAFPLVIEKNSKPREIVGIEQNPIAHKYAIENLKLNKSKINFLKWDVNKIVPKLNQKFDRILMPLPHHGETYLNLPFLVGNKSFWLHFYDVAREEEFDNSKKKVIDAIKKHKKKCKSIEIIKCGHLSPGKFRICVDAKIY